MKLYNFFSKSLKLIAAFGMGLIFILNLVFNASVSYNSAEKVTISNSILRSVLLFMVGVAVLVAASFLRKFFNKIKEEYLFISFSAIYALMAAFLIFNVDNSIRADALSVSQSALALLSGSSLPFSAGGYINLHPHQVGLMLFDTFLYLFTKNNIIIFLANFLFVLGINFIIYKISDLIFADRLTNNITIILSFAFLPQFFFILFAYGTVPGLFFMVFAFFHALKFSKTHSWVNLVFAVVGAVCAVALRKNMLIGVIAIIIFISLEMLKKFSYKQIVLVGCILLSMILPMKILPSLFVDENQGVPSVLWVAMGTDIDNEMRAPGWYDGSNNIIFEEADYDAATTGEMGKEKLAENLQKIKNAPLASAKFFTKKTVSQWCDPLYQSLWSGPLGDCGQQVNTPILKSLYNGGVAEKALSNLMKCYVLLFFALGLLFIIKYNKQYPGWEMFFLLFIGGLIFHIFWEGKSQYIYPYFFSLIPFAALACSKTITKIQSVIKKQGN